MQYPGAPSWDAHVEHMPLKTLDQQYGLSRTIWRKYVAGEVDFPGNAGTLHDEDYAAIDIPVLLGVGWWDDHDTMLAWEALQSSKSVRDCRLLIGAWDHAGNVAPRPLLGGWDVSASVMDTVAHIEQFLALHLKGERTALVDKPRCRVFLTGENCWDELDQWPHPGAVDMPLYLASSGDARSLRGNGRLVSEPLMVSGRYRLCVFVSSDRPDTDLYVSLSDVHPDGRTIGLRLIIQSACLRLRYRYGAQAELLEPGEISEISIDGSWMHHLFKAGHRVRIAISSGNFPVTARNAGSGLHWAEDEVLYPQTNTIYHSSACPSRVMLPVVPPEAR